MSVSWWGTGFGAILSGSDADTPVIGNIGSPTMYVGNTAVTPVYAGRSSQYPGLDQVNFYVPQGVQGCYVPIAVKAGGTVSNIGTIAVSSAGTNTCSDSVMGQDLVNQLASGSNVSFGYIRLLSQSATYAGLAAAGNSSGDYAYATFSEFTPQTAYLAEYGVSTGYCVASSEQYPADMSIAQLDAGSALVFTVSPLVAPGPMTLGNHPLETVISQFTQFNGELVGNGAEVLFRWITAKMTSQKRGLGDPRQTLVLNLSVLGDQDPERVDAERRPEGEVDEANAAEDDGEQARPGVVGQEAPSSDHPSNGEA